MAKIFKNFFQLARNDLANQYALPAKSLTGYLLTNHFTRKTEFLNKAVITSLNMNKDDNVLEFGYGRGNGIKHALNAIKDGKGVIYGIERSAYMENVCRKKFVLEIAENEQLRLDQAIDLRHLPYPSDFFNHVFHVDVFYFIVQESLPRICSEVYRVMKPGGNFVCGLELSRLKRLTEWGLLDESQWDPLRYIMLLEPAGFVDVKIDYHTAENGKNYEVITARKPNVDENYFDPEERMRQLELQIKKDLLINELIQSGKKPTKEDLELINEEIK